MSEVAYSVGANSVTIMKDGEIYMLDDTDARFTRIKAALQAKEPKIDEALKLMDLKEVVRKASAGRVSIDSTGVMFDGKPLGGYMAERLAAMAGSGMDVKPWLRFTDNLMENPSADAREDVFRWMEAGKLPITEDGCIVAFKKVRENYRDVHTGQFDNSVGAVLSMPREKCDPNRNVTCSTGFHFCSADYLRNFGGQRVMVVKVDPRDVTSIPTDYNNSKGRCCKYEVTAELSSQSAAAHSVFSEPVMPQDPQEIPDLLAPVRNPKDAKSPSKGPESPIGRKGASRKIAANAAAAKGLPKAKSPAGKSKESAVKTSTKKTSGTKKAGAKKTTPTGTVRKVTKKVSKAASKIVAGLTEAIEDATGSKPSRAKRTTVKAGAAKTPAKAKKGAPAQSTPEARARKASPTGGKVAGKSKATGRNVLKPASTTSGRSASKAPAKANTPKSSKPTAKKSTRKK
jgi:hypothetical protein